MQKTKKYIKLIKTYFNNKFWNIINQKIKLISIKKKNKKLLKNRKIQKPNDNLNEIVWQAYEEQIFWCSLEKYLISKKIKKELINDKIVHIRKTIDYLTQECCFIWIDEIKERIDENL